MVPKGVKSILDVGSAGNLYSGEGFKLTTLDVNLPADILQDLNKKQILPFKDNSFDLVALNQILEHIGDVDVLIKEAKRVSKKYIFVGLPNELTIRARVKFLLGKPDWEGYRPYWHKHLYTIKSIESFIILFFKGYKLKFFWSAMSIFPEKFQETLANLKPSLFAKEVWYLIEVKK